MKILLTGASGFIGRRLVAGWTRDSGDELVALVRAHSSAHPACRNVRLREFNEGDVTRVVVREKPDAIIHLAAAGVDPRDRDVSRLIDTNVHLPAVLVRAAAEAGTRTLVMGGSSAEYAAPRERLLVTEDAAPECWKLYGATKAAGGMLALAIGLSVDVRVSVLRLFNIYGPGESPHRLFPSIIAAARAGHTVPLSAGTQVRDFVEVDDACSAIRATVRAMNSSSMAGGHYNVCSGLGTTVASFARTLVAAMGAGDELLGFGALPMRPDDVDWLVGDPSRLQEAAGWRAKSLAAGVAHAVQESAVDIERPTESPEFSSEP